MRYIGFFEMIGLENFPDKVAQRSIRDDLEPIRTAAEQDQVRIIRRVVDSLDARVLADYEARIKPHESILLKMVDFLRGPDGVYDLVGIRLYGHDFQDCISIAQQLFNEFPVVYRYSDSLTVPRKSGYQSLDFNLVVVGEPVQVQVRTHEMHKRSLEGPASHARYKQREKEKVRTRIRTDHGYQQGLLSKYLPRILSMLNNGKDSYGARHPLGIIDAITSYTKRPYEVPDEIIVPRSFGSNGHESVY